MDLRPNLSEKDKNIKRYIYLLVFILFGGIILFVSSNIVLQSFLDDLDFEKKNERSRIEISNVLVENIMLIEKGYYKIFTVNSDVARKLIVDETEKYFLIFKNALNVLEKGGVLSVVTKINLEGKTEFTEIYEYYPQENSISIISIELRPKLLEVEKFLEKTLSLINKIDKLSNDKDAMKNIEKVKLDIFTFSRLTATSFNRLRENANRYFYSGAINLERIDKEIETSKEYYRKSEKILLIIIVVTMLFLSFIIVRKINKILQQLTIAKQEVLTSAEELEGATVQLTQEKAEKRLAEEALEITEDRLLTMWNSVHSGVLLVHKENYKIIDCNPSASKMLHLQAENIIGNSCNNFLLSSEGDKCSFVENNVKDDSATDCFLYTAEGQMTPILKTEATIELNGVEYWLVSFTDITILKEAEKALVESKEHAENADKLKSIFLAQMSHEIRTPINVMLSMTSLLELETEDKFDEEQKSYFGIISRAGNRITRTIDLLLNLSEIQANTYEPIIKRFDINSDVISGLLVEYKKKAKEKDLTFIVNFDTEDSYVNGDFYTIEQIFRQLLDNSILFTPKGGIVLSILRNKENRLVVEVQDSGVGIGDEYLDDLFTPFSQEDMGYTRKFDGNGIGLSLVKNYCDLNNAIIEVESEKGIGSTFRVIF